MANVSIRIGTTEDDKRPACVVIDGVDMTDHILATGFAVQLPNHPHERAVVTMSIRADRLDLDLPEAVIDAVAVERSPRLVCEPMSAQATAAEVARLQCMTGKA